MKAPVDPARLSRTAPRGSALQQGIDAARSRGPTQEQVGALERNVWMSVAAAGVSATVPAPATAAEAIRATSSVAGAPGAAPVGLSAGTLKLGASLLVVAGVVGLGTVAWIAVAHRGRGGVSSLAAVRTDSIRAQVRDGVGDDSRRAERMASVVRGPAVARAPVAPSPSPAAEGLITRQSPAPRRSGIRLPASATTVPAASAGARAAARETRAAARDAAGSSAGSAAASLSSGPSADELKLLERAQRSVASAPAAALALTAEHQRRFPAGLLSEEREVIAVTALMNLGRVQEARQRAERFAGAHPGSAYTIRIQGVLAAKTF